MTTVLRPLHDDETWHLPLAAVLLHCTHRLGLDSDPYLGSLWTTVCAILSQWPCLGIRGSRRAYHWPCAVAKFCIRWGRPSLLTVQSLPDPPCSSFHFQIRSLGMWCYFEADATKLYEIAMNLIRKYRVYFLRHQREAPTPHCI